MMTTQWKLKVGDLLHVRTQHTFAGVTKSYILSGKVVASARYDPKDTFRLYTGNSKFPVSIVSYDRITGIKLREVA